MLNLPMGSFFANSKAVPVAAKRLPSATLLVHPPLPVRYFNDSASSMSMFMNRELNRFAGTSRMQFLDYLCKAGRAVVTDCAATGFQPGQCPAGCAAKRHH